MKAAVILAASTLALVGCERCELKFTDGQLVKHRILDDLGGGIVLDSARFTNLEGMCLANVRWSNGRLSAVSIDELETRHD